MARSSYIYLVRDRSNKVVAAFTVKREAHTWVSRRTDYMHLSLSRIGDGVFGDKEEVSMPWEFS